MIEKIVFENFRGFQRIELDDVKPITLISGKNNTGKSSILEGLFLMFERINPNVFMQINQLRGLPILLGPNVSPSDVWEPLFFNMDTKHPLKIKITKDKKDMTLYYNRDETMIPSDTINNIDIKEDAVRTIMTSSSSNYALKSRFETSDYQEEGHFGINKATIFRKVKTNLENHAISHLYKTHFINSSVVNSFNALIPEWYSSIVVDDETQKVLEVFQIIDPSITKAAIVYKGGFPQLYVKVGAKMMPIKLAGDGFNRLIFIALCILANPNAVILIDEIETGFHYAVYKQLWEKIISLAIRNKCQIIATTHSRDCIESAVEAVDQLQHQDKFCYFRLQRDGQERKAIHFSYEEIADAVAGNMEIR